MKLAIELSARLRAMNIDPRNYTLELWKQDYAEVKAYFEAHDSWYNDGEIADFKLKVNLFERYSDFYKSKWTNTPSP